MAEISDPPTGLASTNTLDGIEMGGGPAELRLAGKILCVMANPPGLGSDVVLMVKLRAVEDCLVDHEDSSQSRYLKCRLVGAWLPGSPPPIDVNQGSLWEQAGPVGSTTPDEPPPQ